MQPTQHAQVHLIDDDASVREALAWLLRSRGLPSVEHVSADDFLADWQQRKRHAEPCCLLLDVRMPGTSGLALFDWWVSKQLTDECPVIFLSGHADVPTAVDAVKRGATNSCATWKIKFSCASKEAVCRLQPWPRPPLAKRRAPWSSVLF